LQKNHFILENNSKDSLYKLDHNQFSTFTDYEIKQHFGNMKKNYKTKNYKDHNNSEVVQIRTEQKNKDHNKAHAPL
jgi:hypothetical protein